MDIRSLPSTKLALALVTAASMLALSACQQQPSPAPAAAAATADAPAPAPYVPPSAEQLYKLVANLNKARKNAIRNDPSFLTTGANPIYVDTTTIAVKKGKLMTVLSNKGSSGSNYTQPIRSYYQSGSSVTELLSCTKYTSDSGSFINVPMSAGMPRVFYPTADIGTLCGGATKDSVAGASSSADTEVDAAAAETYSDSTSSADASSSDATSSESTSSESASSDSSSSDSTVLDSSMSRPARPNRPSRPNRATRNRAARPSRAKLARRSSNMKAARWAA